MTVTVANRQNRVRFDLRWLRKFAEASLAPVAKHSAMENPPLSQLDAVEVTIISDRAIAKTHWQFMNIAGPTDVITFAHGEILISAETAKVNAERYNVSLEHELALYIVHGLLHLNGFDDRTPRSAARMRAVQNKVLQTVLALSIFSKTAL